VDDQPTNWIAKKRRMSVRQVRAELRAARQTLRGAAHLDAGESSPSSGRRIANGPPHGRVASSCVSGRPAASGRLAKG
jgi:hypothetical protein